MLNRFTIALLAGLLAVGPFAAADEPFLQERNIVYGESHGVGLLMDVFTPARDKNGLGIVLVTSGGWKSGRDLIDLFQQSEVISGLCAEGYAVFAVRPGSSSKFNATEMLEHLRHGIRWVKQRAGEYGIDPNRLGMLGASAGGHLTLLTAATSEDDTRVQAAAAIFPPTDFVDYGGKPLDLRSEDGVAQLVRGLLFPEGVAGAARQRQDSPRAARARHEG